MSWDDYGDPFAPDDLDLGDGPTPDPIGWRCRTCLVEFDDAGLAWDHDDDVHAGEPQQTWPHRWEAA